MSNTYFISDLHFNHKRIIESAGRPFNDVVEMNRTLINNWNKVVRKEDTVWFLGDLGFGDRDLVKSLTSQLNGHIKMIKGNHDTKPNSYYYSCGIEYVSNYPIILKGHFILSHYPMLIGDAPFYNIFGHLHNRPIPENVCKQHKCVSVERIGYKPIRIEEFENYKKSK